MIEQRLLRYIFFSNKINATSFYSFIEKIFLQLIIPIVGNDFVAIGELIFFSFNNLFTFSSLMKYFIFFNI